MKQEYTIIPITRDQVLPVAYEMRHKGVILAMIHGYLEASGDPVISYEYQLDPDIVSYTVRGEFSVPSISEIYDKAAEWPERELQELYGFTFEGLDVSQRLFLPDNMLSGQGQIMVTPMEELIANRYKTNPDGTTNVSGQGAGFGTLEAISASDASALKGRADK